MVPGKLVIHQIWHGLGGIGVHPKSQYPIRLLGQEQIRLYFSAPENHPDLLFL